ncbi:Crp/Fnr family transcriptional regulator [Chitinophaga sp. XS-30]|uniref:Crp/Fnr family transcriptional regulator n=1 Tax=Chitinophaga sp. XS-30 TaxID=2604421 RepID=UPI0011DE1435|nr:Crp/Fnr family transcriptional regulator [Chitinophaga sp. XS-30]QEH41925.1 Crp/Fnr family transcriptional regulator [Chitinophaga sp. XS-30]
MNTGLFFQKIRTYYNISEQAEKAWAELLTHKKYKKGDNFISIGEHPKKVAFVINGLFSQNFITDEGNIVIKYFFPEQRMATSLSAMLGKHPSPFYIEAIEDTTVFEYDFFEFKKLFDKYPDIAQFYIKYNEQHWIIEKEPLEISMRTETSAKRYDDLLKKYPNLLRRLKKHHIASYLGITPTQLSRIFFANK